MVNLLSLAYLDPGAGSMLLQAIVGGSAGLIVFARHVWRSWKFKSSPADNSEDAVEIDDSTAAYSAEQE